jgi:hypothetical protein
VSRDGIQSKRGRDLPPISPIELRPQGREEGQVVYFQDHNDDARIAVFKRSVECNPANRHIYKDSALALAKTLVEARRAMAVAEGLEVIEEVLCERVFNDVNAYVASFIPMGEDDDLRGAFENIACNCFADNKIFADEAYFERLDAELEKFRREELSLFV